MSEELWKYLPHIPQAVKKSNPLKRKSEVTDKQVLNLTRGMFPLKIVDGAKQINQKQIEKVDHYVYRPIIQKNPKIGPIYHWVKQDQQKKLYHGQKFNVDPDIPQFSEAQYNQLGLTQWNFATVHQVFELMKRYNLNFIIAHDRLQNSTLTVEDLKEIYFTVCKRIYHKRDQKEKVLYSYSFDKKYQTNRKYELQKYMMRNKVDTDREKYLISQIKRLEILIKKQERQQINLKKVLKLDEIPQQNFQLDQDNPNIQIHKTRKIYTRQQYLMSPLKLPGKVHQKLLQVLAGMNIPQKIIATQQNTELFDKLRQKILLMFSIQRYIKKKQNQRRLLEQKKKRINTQEQDQKKNPIKSMDPKKKIHPNPPINATAPPQNSVPKP